MAERSALMPQIADRMEQNRKRQATVGTRESGKNGREILAGLVEVRVV